MDGGDDFSLTDNLDKMNSQDASKETDKAPQRVQPPIKVIAQRLLAEITENK